MDIINNFKNDKYQGQYILLAILSLVTFEKFKKVEQKKKDLYNLVPLMFPSDFSFLLSCTQNQVLRVLL